MLKKQLLSIFEALLYIMLTYWLIDSFFAFNKYDWMLESGDNICSIPSVSGRRSYIASNDCSIFSSDTTYYSYLKKTLYAGNVRVLAICIHRSLFVWVVVGGFFGDGLYFAISKVL